MSKSDDWMGVQIPEVIDPNKFRKIDDDVDRLLVGRPDPRDVAAIAQATQKTSQDLAELSVQLRRESEERKAADKESLEYAKKSDAETMAYTKEQTLKDRRIAVAALVVAALSLLAALISIAITVF